MKFCGRCFALLAVCLLLPLATFAADSETAAASETSPAAALADHLERTRLVAERLQSQIAHPRGRPEARAELAELMAHLGRLQKATAELGGEAGAALEAERAELLDRLRGLGRKDRRRVEALGGSGSIAGRVTVAATGNPQANVEVIAYHVGGFFVASAPTDANGEYLLSGLDDGGYFVGTDLSPYTSPYLNVVYEDVYCTDYGLCPTTTATPVTVAGGAAVSGIDFDLVEGGKLSGRVFDQDGAPIVGVYLTLYNSLGTSVAQAVTDVAGRYTVRRQLPGVYYLQAVSDRHLDELYHEIPCEGGACSILTGQALTVALDSQLINLDFTLARRGTLRGKVVDATSLTPIPFASVQVQGSSDSRSVYTDQLGEWEVGDLSAGTYYARASQWNYRGELYSGIPCPGNSCTMTSGTPIVLAEGGTLATIDFSLDRLGAISGSIKAAGSLDPLSGSIRFFNDEGSYVGSAFGSSFTFDGLETGNYFVVTDVFSSEYQDELWQDIPCPLSCNVTTGAPVPVALGQVSSGIDFVLDRLGRIEGRVTASAGGAGLAEAYVSAYHAASGSWLASGSTDAQGYYRITGLPPGNYKVQASLGSYRSELWDGVPCSGECNPAAGQNVAVTLAGTTAGIHFALERLATISGTVRDQTTNLPLANQRIELRTAGNLFAGTWYTDENGFFSAEGLADGSYFAKAENNSNAVYWSEIWNAIDCRICPPINTGTPIAVSIGNSRDDIDFTLIKGGQIQGTVISAATGQPAAGYVKVYNGGGVYQFEVPVNAGGEFTVAGLDTGNYFLLAYSSNPALAREVWPNVVCLPPNGACNPLQGMPVAVSVGQVSAANFALDLLGSLTGRIVDAETGAPVGNGYVELYTSSGDFYGLVIAGPGGEYLMVGLGPGEYKLHTASNPSHIERVYGGSACENTVCELGSGTALRVAMGQTAVAEDLPLAFGPGIAGWVRKEGSAAYAVGIDVWSSSGAYVGTAASNAAGRYRLALAAGSYYVTTDNGGGFIDEVFNDVACPDGPAYLGLCDPLDGNPVAVAGGAPALDAIDFDLESPTALFRDGFESGNFGAWSTVIGN